jgi:hypothetical protein
VIAPSNELVALVAVLAAGICWCVDRLCECYVALREIESRRAALAREPSPVDARPIAPRPLEPTPPQPSETDPFGIPDLLRLVADVGAAALVAKIGRKP